MRCVAVVLLRHRSLIRSVIAAKVPSTAIDDVSPTCSPDFSPRSTPRTRSPTPPGCCAHGHLPSSRLSGAPAGWRGSARRLDDAADDPAFDAITDEDAVDELLAPLNQRQRNAVWGRIVEGGEREVAAMLDTTPGTST